MDMIENYVVELANKYLKYNVPLDVVYHEEVSKPISLVAGYLLRSEREITVQEVCYLGESDGSEELQLTIQYEFPNKVRVVSPMFFINVFHGVAIVKQYRLDLSSYVAELEKVTVYVAGKKYERVKNRLEQVKQQRAKE